MSAPSRSQQQPPRGASLQDCLFYAGPSGCRNGTACKYRHQLNAEQTRGARPCHKWEANGCQRMDCKFRHGAKTDHGATAQPKQQHSTKSRIEKAAHPVAAAASAGGPPVPASAGPRPIALFWDLENCALPRGCDAFLLVQLLRHHLVTDRRCQEVLFNAYCDAAVLGRKHQEALHHANVRLHSIPATKPGAVDFALLLDLDRFTHSHSPPATIVLLSGDIDFVGKVHMLRHQQGYNVVLVHNAVAKRELKLSANEVIEYKYFTTKLGNGAAPSATAGAPEKETKQKTGSKGELAAAAANQQPKQKQQQPQQQPKPIAPIPCDSTALDRVELLVHPSDVSFFVSLFLFVSLFSSVYAVFVFSVSLLRWSISLLRRSVATPTGKRALGLLLLCSSSLPESAGAHAALADQASRRGHGARRRREQ